MRLLVKYIKDGLTIFKHFVFDGLYITGYFRTAKGTSGGINIYIPLCKLHKLADLKPGVIDKLKTEAIKLNRCAICGKRATKLKVLFTSFGFLLPLFYYLR